VPPKGEKKGGGGGSFQKGLMRQEKEEGGKERGLKLQIYLGIDPSSLTLRGGEGKGEDS